MQKVAMNLNSSNSLKHFKTPEMAISEKKIDF